MPHFALTAAILAVAAGPALSQQALAPKRSTNLRVAPVFETNTGHYDPQVKFLTRIGRATVFLTDTGMTLVLPAKARGQRQEARGEGREARGAATVSPAPFGGRGLGGGGAACGTVVPIVAQRLAVTGTPPSPLPPPAGGGGGNGPLTHPGRPLSALSPQPSAPSHVLRMNLLGAKPGVPRGLQKQPGIVNYIIGNDPAKWRTRVPTYTKAKLAGVYPGIDVVYYGREPRGKSQEPRGGGNGPLTHPGRSLSALSSQLSALEYDFILHPGADPSRIRLAFEGAERVRVAGGDIILTTPAGDVRMKRPYAYQTIGGKRVQVACDYKLHSPLAAHHSPRVAFRLAKYDASKPLVVDPVIVLTYSGFLGGLNDDVANDIAADAAGSAYVVGSTQSSGFPTSAGSYRPTFGSLQEVFVTKLDSTGTAMLYSTFVGGSSWQEGHGIAVDAGGVATITGYTGSADFPTTPGAYDTTHNGSEDVFVTKLDASGSALVSSTLIGGAASDRSLAIAVDGEGAAYVTGYTGSSNYPTTAGAFDTTHNGRDDIFVTKVSADATALAYSTYLGTSMYEAGHDIAVDGTGSAYIVGYTGLNGFPTTTGAFDTSYNGGRDAVVVKLNAAGTGLVYSTYLGGYGDDEGNGVFVDGTGAAYITGYSISGDFPLTQGAFSTTHGGASDVFVTKINAAGNGLICSTLMGGFDFDYGNDVDVDTTGTVSVVGATASSAFPTTPGGLDTTWNGFYDGFVARLSPSLSTLEYGTYLGGTHGEFLNAVIRVADGSLVCAGSSTSADFPTTAGFPDTTHNGGDDAIVVRLDAIEPSDTTLYTIDRTGTITGLVILRQFDLKRTTDNMLLAGKTISFKVDGTEVGTGVTNGGGDSTLNWTITDGLATRTITAAFAGDVALNGCSDDATLTAETHATKMFGVDREGRITAYRIFKAWLYRLDSTPVVGKSVSFKLDGTLLGSDITRSTGLAQIGYTIADGAGAGARTILAEWAGDGGYLASSCTNTLTVLKATPYIWVMPRSVPQGGVARMYAYFRRLADYQKQEGKTVTFRVDGTWIADVVTLSGAEAGIARYYYTSVEAPGAHTLRCDFAGDAWVDAGYGEANLTIY